MNSAVLKQEPFTAGRFVRWMAAGCGKIFPALSVLEINNSKLPNRSNRNKASNKNNLSKSNNRLLNNASRILLVKDKPVQDKAIAPQVLSVMKSGQDFLSARGIRMVMGLLMMTNELLRPIRTILQVILTIEMGMALQMQMMLHPVASMRHSQLIDAPAMQDGRIVMELGILVVKLKYESTKAFISIAKSGRFHANLTKNQL